MNRKEIEKRYHEKTVIFESLSAEKQRLLESIAVNDDNDVKGEENTITSIQKISDKYNPKISAVQADLFILAALLQEFDDKNSKNAKEE